MSVPTFDPEYAEWLSERLNERFDTWHEAECRLWVTGWPWAREFWPAWTWPHLTDAMVDEQLSLPFRVVYGVLVERSGLPLAARAVLHYLARRCGGPSGAHRRAWPKLDTIADRIGASRATVKRAVRVAEKSGWLVVVRHTKLPSDYLLDVPEYAACPCIDCRDDAFAMRSDEPPEGVNVNPRGVNVNPSAGQDEPPGGQDEPSRGSKRATHLVHALGSEHLVHSPDSEHLRRTSDDVTTDGMDRPKKEPPTAYESGQRYATYVAEGKVSRDEVTGPIADMYGQEKPEFLKGFRQAEEVAA